MGISNDSPPQAAAATPVRRGKGINSLMFDDGATGREMTRESVKQAAADIVASLPAPAKVEVPPMAREKLILVVCGKDGKTCCSIANHSKKVRGVPRPKGSIVVVLTAEPNAETGYENFLLRQGTELVDPGEYPHFLDLSREVGTYRPIEKFSDPAEAAYFVAVYVQVLLLLSYRGDVGLLVLDGFGDICNSVMDLVACYESGVSSTDKLEGTQWRSRRTMFTTTLERSRRAVCRGGFVVANGPGGGVSVPESRDKLKEKKLKEQLEKRIQAECGGRYPPLMSKWVMYREVNKVADAIVSVAPSDSGRFYAETWSERLASVGFDPSPRDLDGGHIGLMFTDVGE